MSYAPSDDDESLQAVLSFLEDLDPLEDVEQTALDVDAAQLQPIEPISPLAFAAPDQETTLAQVNGKRTGKQRKPRTRASDFQPNRARNERKNELIYLRGKVLEMETQLEALQKNEGGRAGVAALGSVESLITGPATMMLNGAVLSRGRLSKAKQPSQFVWEQIASRQLEARQRAEVENVRLKTMLEGQIKVAKGLERLLEKRSNAQMHQLYSNGMIPFSKRRHHPSTHADEAAIFEALLAGLDKSLEEVDAIFEANGLSKTEESFQDAIVRNGRDNNSISLEIFANTIMPFNIYATSDAVWKHLVSLIECMPFRSYYLRQPKSMNTTDDTIVESFGVEVHVKGTIAHFWVCQVMRRYFEEDRILITWRQTFELMEFSAHPTSGIQFHENGYIVLKKPSTRSGEYSLVQTCFVITPEWYDQSPEFQSKIGHLSDFLVNCTAQKIFMSHQMIENFLLDESLKQGNETT